MRTILGLLLLVLNNIALATNYYVSNTGNDSNDGKSPSSAWRTMANVDNNTSFQPGDSILFERGGVWYENFRIAVSGSPKAQITYGAYGTGDRPIISGMREVPGWDNDANWTERTDLGDNIWSLEWSSTRDRLRIWIDDDEKQRSGSLAVSESNPWQWFEDVFYIFSKENPAIAYASIETPSFHMFLRAVTDKDYITIRDLDISGWYTSRLYGCSYWIIDNCIWGKYFSGDGIRVLRSSANSSVGGVIKNNIVDSYDRLPVTYVDLTALGLSSRTYNTDDGIRMLGCSEWDIHHNYVRAWGHTNISIESAGEIVESIRVFNNYSTNIGMSYGRGLGGGLNPENANPDRPVEFFNNIVEDQGVQSQIIIAYAKVYNNIFNRTRGAKNNPLERANALWIAGSFATPAYMKIYNNIFANAQGYGLVFWDRISDADAIGNTIANNIFYNNRGYDGYPGRDPLGEFFVQLLIDDNGNNKIKDNIFENNLFYNPNSNTPIRVYGKNITAEEFNALDNDENQNHKTSNNLTDDPIFKDPENDNFKLKSGSPAIGVGKTPLSNHDLEGDEWIEPFSIGPFNPPEQFILTIDITGNGFVKAKGESVINKSITIDDNSTIYIEATPYSGWIFSNWAEDATGHTNPLEVTMDTNKNIVAVFTEDAYNLTITSEGEGSVAINPDIISYSFGTPVYLEAIPELGWKFSNWAGDETGQSNPLEVTMDENKSITAVFTEETYNLTINSDGDGSVNINPDKLSYSFGTPVYLEAIPELGWKFSNWAGDEAGQSNPLEVTMDEDKSITAVFTEDAYNLIITSEGEGSVNINPDQLSYSFGTPIYLQATPKEGWQFDEWNGDLYSNSSSESFLIEKDMKITVKYSTIPKSGNPITNASDRKIFPDAKNNIFIYPNPAKDYFRVDIKESVLESGYYQIINMNGKIIYEDLLNAEITDVQIPATINTGIYIIKIILGGLPYYVQRLVISR